MGLQPRIAIVGAGPGGLMLARILHVHGIPAAVFEQEEHDSVRRQGGTLDIHLDTGQFALCAAGLEAEFKRIARYEDQDFRLYDKHGHLQLEDTGNDGQRPEVDRTQLRQILLASLPDEVVRWGHALNTVQPESDGTYELQFQNGARERFDLVVGADGAWSRVRPLVSQVRPAYSGITFVELNLRDADVRHPQIASLVGHGKMFALGDSKALMAQRNANALVQTYAGLKVAEDWATAGGLDRWSNEAMKAGLAKHFEGWSETLLQLIHKSDDPKSDGPVAARPIYALRAGHRWENRPGITLLGDAAHLMSPFSGEGVNLAMRDAADLALALVREADWNAAIERCETGMFARAEEAAVVAQRSIEQAFSQEGVALMIRQMESHRAGRGAGRL